MACGSFISRPYMNDLNIFFSRTTQSLKALNYGVQLSICWCMDLGLCTRCWQYERSHPTSLQIIIDSSSMDSFVDAR